MLTVHGTSDKIVPKEDAKKFAEPIPNHQLHMIKELTTGALQVTTVVSRFIKKGGVLDVKL